MKKLNIIKREEVIVKNCSNCPGLHQNSEYPDSYCGIAERHWMMGYYDKGPAPSWCPLRNSITTKIISIYKFEEK